jgi:hypothetical protein
MSIAACSCKATEPPMDAQRWAQTEDVDALIRYAYTSAHGLTDDGSTRLVRARPAAYKVGAELYAEHCDHGAALRFKTWTAENCAPIDAFAACRSEVRKKMADAARVVLGDFDRWSDRRACPTFKAGIRGRCMFCYHEERCHPSGAPPAVT